MSMERPAEALALAERIEGIIPGFRETRLLAGSAQAMAGDYAGAAASLRLFLGQNLISPPAYARLIACEAMLAHPAAVAEAIEGFFIWMHKYYMRNRGDYFELEERELRILPSGESARSYHDSDKNISELGGRYLARVAQVLVAKRPGDFLSAYVSANLALGGLLDELDYSDAGLAFYADALSSSRLDLGSEGLIEAKFKAYYDKAEALLEEALAAGDASREARARKFLKKIRGLPPYHEARST